MRGRALTVPIVAAGAAPTPVLARYAFRLSLNRDSARAGSPLYGLWRHRAVRRAVAGRLERGSF